MRVLVAEDERAVCELIERALTRSGYAVTGVSSCAEALETLRAEAFDIVVFDLQLHDGGGFQIVEDMDAGLVKTAALVLMTGDGLDESDPRVRRVGVVLRKPFGLDELEEAILRVSA